MHLRNQIRVVLLGALTGCAEHVASGSASISSAMSDNPNPTFLADLEGREEQVGSSGPFSSDAIMVFDGGYDASLATNPPRRVHSRSGFETPFSSPRSSITGRSYDDHDRLLYGGESADFGHHASRPGPSDVTIALINMHDEWDDDGGSPQHSVPHDDGDVATQ